MTRKNSLLEKEFLQLGFTNFKEMATDPQNDGGTFLTTREVVPSLVDQGTEEIHFYFVISYPEDDQSPFIKYIAASRIGDIHSFNLPQPHTTVRYWKDQGPLPSKQEIIRSLSQDQIHIKKIKRARQIASKGFGPERESLSAGTSHGNGPPTA